MLDLESEAMRGPGSIPTGGNILSLGFFYVVKPLMPILALLPILSICEKPGCYFCFIAYLQLQAMNALKETISG